VKSSTDIDVAPEPMTADGDPESTLAVTLGQFAARALSASGEPDHARLERTLAQAIRYYLIDADARPPGWAYPTFLPADTGAGAAGPGFEVPLERGAWDALCPEAERQGVEPGALLQHAALYFAAARDAGRLTGELLEALEKDEG
jgi:hypothetical protein